MPEMPRHIAVWVASILLLLGSCRVGLGRQALDTKSTACGAAEDSVVESAPKLNLAGRVRDRKPIPARQDDEEEALAYADTLAAARRSSALALTKAARRDLSYAQLWEEPEKYRGEIIHVEGRLRRLRSLDAPDFIASAYGIAKIYEGWVFEPEIYGANPRCVLFTERPQGIEAREELDEHVAFDGYFFKLYRYRAGDGWRDAPLFMAHSLKKILRPGRGKESMAAFSSGQLATAFLTVLAATAVLVAGLAWWYRRGDHRVRSHLPGPPVCRFFENAPNESAGH